MTTFTDDFVGSAGVLDGRVSSTGHTWYDSNDALRLDGSGRLIRNASTASNVGSYGQIDLADKATSMWADISFTGTSDVITENGGVVLISGVNAARGGNPPTAGIFHNAVHAVFGCWQAAISIWENDAAVSPNLITYTYPGGKLALDGTTVYRIQLYFDGQRLGALMPDGATKWAADPRINTYTGTHLIYQVYNSTAPNLNPRIETAWADTAALNFGGTPDVELPW